MRMVRPVYLPHLLLVRCTTDRGVRPMSQCEAVHRSERDPDRNPGIRAVSIGVDLRVHESIAASRKES
jgi:hypothetical protein